MHLQISDIQWILKLSLLRRYFQIDFATGDNEKTTGLLNIKRTADYRSLNLLFISISCWINFPRSQSLLRWCRHKRFIDINFPEFSPVSGQHVNFYWTGMEQTLNSSMLRHYFFFPNWRKPQLVITKVCVWTNISRVGHVPTKLKETYGNQREAWNIRFGNKWISFNFKLLFSPFGSIRTFPFTITLEI